MANTENIWDELLKKQQEQFGLGTNTQEEETLDVEVPKAVIENPVEETAGIVEDAKVDNTVVTPKAEVVTPTPKEDKIADMYAYLQKGGYDKLGTLDEFRQKMGSDPEFEDEVGYNLYAVNQANELKQRDQLKEYYKGLKKQGIVKDDQQTFVNNMINDESYRQAVSDNISAYNAKVQKKIDAAKKAKAQSTQTTAPVMAENTENVNGRSEGWGQLNLTPETGLPQIIAERARKTRLENEAKTKTMAQAIEEAKLKELYDVLQGNRKTSEGLTQMSAQLRDRMDYFAITGKELKDDVLDMTQFGVAPTVVKDENGNVLKGSVNNATRANVQRYEQERVQRENIDRQLEEAKAEEERLMKLVDEVGETTITNYPSQFGVYTNVHNTPDRSAIQASLRQVRERMDALEQEKNGGQRGFFNGLTTTLTDGSTWMFGVDKLYDTKLIYDISKKVERGEELSEYEKLLLDTMYKTQEVQSRLDENSDWLYRAGVVTGNQIPFMAQIYLTKGFGAIAEIGAEAGTRWAAAYAKKFGQDALVHRIMANTIKGLGVTAGDVAAGFASANTTGLANTANDALQRATGQLVKDEDGNYNFEGAEDLWRAIGKAEVSQTKEFATERFGEHIPGLRKLNVWIAKTGNTGRKLARALSGVAGSSAVRTTSKFLNKAGMQGIVPEIIEEEIGLPIDVAIGDMTWEEALSKKNQWDIVGGMLLSVGAMHGATLTAVGAGKVYNTAQYYKYKNRADKQGRVAAFRLGEDRWNEWKDKIDMTTTEDMNDLWEEVRNDNTLEVQEKRAIFDYINSLTAARAYNLGMLFQSRVAAENPELKPEAITPAEKEKISVISSEDKGYNIDQPKDMNEAKLDLDYQAQRINEILGEELANGIINSTAHVGDIIDQIIGNEKLTDEQRQVAFDYLNAKQVYNGMINRAQDDIDSRIAFNNEKIDQNSNENGIITTATLKDGSPVYVVRGDVFLDQDGNFIKANSSNSIVVRNQITGAIQMIDPSEVASIESSQPADQLKKDSAAQIRMQMAQERAAQIDGTLSFIPGDVYTMSDEQGMPLQVEVVADNGDGSVQVNYNGQPTVMPKEQLQAMNDEYNRQSAIFRSERKQANAGQKTSTQRRAEKLAKQQPVQEVEKEPTALDKVPVDENGQRHYEQAKAGDAYDALVEQLGIEGAAQVATIEKEKARKAFEAATKKIPTGNTTDEVITSARQIAQERAAAERLYAHWNAIETTPMMRENADRIAQDMIRKAKEAEQSSNPIAKEMNDLYASLQKAKDEEKQPILDKLSDLIRTFAADNGYDCEVLNSIEAFLNAPGIAHRRADYEAQMAAGIISPGYTFQGKIYINTAHCMPEGAETFYDYVEGTLVHEATHVDNKEDDRQVMFLAQAIREGSVKLEEALDIIGRLSGVNTYTEDAADMTAKGQDPAQMVADELLAHLNQERAINGAVADEFTKNDIIIKLANEVYEKRETKRNSGDRSGRSTTNNASANSTVSGSPADNAGESTDEQVRRSDRSGQKSQDEVTPEFVQQDVERMVASEGLSEETAQDLADVGLTMSGTVPMDYNALALKEETGYHTPNEVSLVDDILFSHGTAPAWAQGFLSGKPTKREQRVAEVILNWYDLAAADELTHDYMSYEVYPEGGLNKDGEGPLRENVEYVHTFDLDTTCPRTFQYLYFADEIEKRIGRPMTQNECIQLIEEMRAHGLQIPCVYCYAENKRQALKNYFNNFINFRNNVLAAKSEKAAFAAMYGHPNNDPTKPISKAAQEVLTRWRDTSVEFNQYRPTIQELTTDYKDARSAILWTLDYWKKEGAISERDSDNSLIAKLCANYRIDTKKNAPKEDKGRMSSIASIVNDWRYDELEHVPHHNYDAENQANGLLSKRMRNGLTLWDEMKKYGASASSAHNAVRYIPYTNELSKITKDKKDYINGMGGLRMHSTNDFRIDYVGDYFQLIADMAKDGWFGHTYTKSPLMVEIFGNTGYRINMSCAAYDEYERDSKGNIVLEEYIDADGKKQTRKKVARVVMNEDEGFNWEVAKRLREQYPNAGPMMMTTSHAQLQFALDADWIDMIIPFHSSGLATEVVDMRLWEDAQSVQNESFYNSDDMRAELKKMDFSDEEIEIMKAALVGKKLTKKAQQAISDNDKAGIVAAFLKKSGGASSDDVKAMFFAKHPEIMKPIMYEDGDEVKKLRPHFLPGVTRPVKKRQDIEIPGWATSTAEDPKQREKENLQNYFNLCRKYGVHPRFHGIMVKDKNGNDIPIEKHPGYIKLIKETARMDTIQEAVKFNLDEPNPNLRVRVNENGDIVADPQGIEGELTDINPKTGEHWTPLEYAFYALKEHASIGGYENYNQDINGIIPDFIKNVIEYHEKTGKERPLSWLSPTGRIAWQMQQNAVDAALKSDKELILKPIPYHEYNAKDYKDMDILASHRKVDTKSPQFKNWFGDWENDPENASKVVDENGEPKVMYRGDDFMEENDFQSGLYLTEDREFAEDYGEDVYEFYVNARNPFDGTKDGETLREFVEENLDSLIEEYDEFFEGEDGYETVDDIMDAINSNWWIALEKSPLLQNEIFRRGYDAIYLEEDEASNIYVPSPNQIKSATDNNGDFDPNNPDIRFSRRRVTPEQDEEYMRAVKGGSTVVTQRMVDQVAEQAGYTVNGYHGTTNRFYVFDKNKANAEGNWGKGFYFTDNYDDVEENYANNDGPDLTGRIERLAESMEWMDGYEDMDYEDRLDAARKELSEGDPRVIDAYLKMENPVKIGGEDETFFDYAENYDEETDEYEEPEGLLLEFVNSLQNVLADVGHDNVDLYPIIEAGYDGLTASELEDVARETIQNEYYADENGDPAAPGEAIRQAFERMGFDGIIDSRVSEKFKTMSGMYAGTTHMIVFSPSQIKLADPITYDNEGNVIPLSQRFNEDNDDIRFSKRVAMADPFYSNAAKAVEGIKQDKATGDQWIAMLQKAGGLKAEEDKWLGLSEWLKETQRIYESGQGKKDEGAKDKIRKYIEYSIGLGETLDDSINYAYNKIFDEPETVDGWRKELVDEVSDELKLGIKKDRNSKTISKQEVMDYISQNAVKVEDVKYAEGYSKAADDAMDTAVKKYGEDLNKAYSFDFDEYSEQMVSFVNDEALAAKIYNKEHGGNIPEDPDKITPDQYETLRHFGDDIVNFIMDVYNASKETKEINGTRINYTTDGLKNKKEIALTVPTVEPYNAGDMIHFGDAGEGRAVAWIRFGDATTKEGLGKKTGRSIMDDLVSRYHTTNPTKMTPEDAARKYYADFLERGEYGDHDTNISFIKSDMGDKASDTIKEYFRIVNESAKESSKVLVIDEIQSKRHQDGRDQGYYDPAKKEEYQSLYKRKEELEKEAQSYWPQYKKAVEDKDEAKMKEILDRADEIMSESAAIEDKLLSFSFPTTGVPDAPFRKNWHELAMKRMLRYAAENGYDKIAWTTGTQQAERYNLSNIVEFVKVSHEDYDYQSKAWSEETKEIQPKFIEVALSNENFISFNVDKEGNVLDGDYKGNKLHDVLGKELADKILNTPVEEYETEYSGNDLRLGGEGMKGFYDQMLPRFMDKYGKKWGVKTGTVELDLPNKADRVMHSVDVTPEMKESVMQGQPMFSRRTKPAPKKTGIGYKVFYKGKDGKLYPPMVANPNGEDTPVGVWLDADAAPVAGQTKTGRDQVKQGGKGTQGGSGKLAYRPGWHLGEIPYALQFNRKDADGNKTLFPKDFVWAEVEYAMDVDYQEEAYKAGMNKNGKYQHSYAGLPYLPTDGYYMYRTNPNPQTDPWIITGSMKVNRILDKSEVDEIVRAAGREPQQVEPEVRFAKRSNLTPSQQKQVKSEAFKAWFGDWEKAQRIERLRISDVATITGDEFEISEDPKKSAFEYAKKLQGEYTNADTGMVIQLQRGRKNGGIKEVLQHNYKDIPHLKSVAAIPQIIEKSIYITSEPNLDKKTNPDVVEYQHYVCGLKIGNEDYTVHAIVAVDNKGNRYYDHNLTYIEKEKLLDHINGGAVTEGFGTMPGTKPTTNSEYKVKKLISILQTNSSKVVDENGEPLVVYNANTFVDDGYGTEGSTEDINAFDRNVAEKGFFFSSDYDFAKRWVEEWTGFDPKRVKAVYLDMKNPYILQANGQDWKNINDRSTDQWAEWAEQNGYDGLIIKKVLEGTDSEYTTKVVDDYVVFSPTQIKSATANNGEFSPTNPDIRFSKRVTPEQDAEYLQAVEAGDMEKAQQMVDEAVKGMKTVSDLSINGKPVDKSNIRRVLSAEYPELSKYDGDRLFNLLVFLARTDMDFPFVKKVKEDNIKEYNREKERIISLLNNGEIKNSGPANWEISLHDTWIRQKEDSLRILSTLEAIDDFQLGYKRTPRVYKNGIEVVPLIYNFANDAVDKNGISLDDHYFAYRLLAGRGNIAKALESIERDLNTDTTAEWVIAGKNGLVYPAYNNKESVRVNVVDGPTIGSKKLIVSQGNDAENNSGAVIVSPLKFVDVLPDKHIVQVGDMEGNAGWFEYDDDGVINNSYANRIGFADGTTIEDALLGIHEKKYSEIAKHIASQILNAKEDEHIVIQEAGEIRYSKRTRRAQPNSAETVAEKSNAVQSMAERLNIEGNMAMHTVADIPEGVDKDAKGWYDPQTNTVHIVPENCIDANDAKATVLHEAVAHYGLRNIMGQENLDKFLDDLYMNNEPIRNEVNKIIAQYGYDYRRATEEYCARMAEQEIPTNVWKRTKAAFKTMLRRAGLKVRLGDNEILYMLWKSKRALNGGDMFDRAADVTKQMELGTGVYYSKRAPVAKGYASAQYEREAASKLLHNREQVQDRMISLDALQNAVAEETGSPILDSENAYLAENRMHGTNKNETEYFDYNYFDPLIGAVNKLMKKAKMSYQQVTDYMMMKHGLERNTEFAMRSATEDLQAKVREQAENAERRRLGIDSMTDPDEIAKAERQVKKAGETAARTVKEQVRKQFLNDADLAALKLDYANGKIDFMEYETERRKIIERYAPGTSAYLATQGDKAGLTQITGEDDDWEQAAFDVVTAIEGKNAAECQELWDRTNAATGWTLKKGRDSGRMTKENYDYVNSMFDYYVPLRSWDDTKADEVYEYMNSKRPAFNPTMKKMKGRQSRAENPIAYIGSMAATEVVLGNQNLMKQYFLRMAQAHPTDLLAVSEMWYENKGTVTAPDWQAAVPVITEDMNIDDIHAEIERFNADMQAKQQAGVAKRSRQGLQITYPATYQQQEEHMVKVSVDGKDFVVYVNGNPKAAQAINGTNKVKGSLEAGKKLNQAIGQFLTSKNPSFIPANFMRDMLAAQTQILIKESPEYIAKFYGNIFTFAKMPSLLRKYKAGKLDESNETERCFKEFMENGGETGYVAMLTSDAFKDNIDKKLKKIGGHYPTMRQAWDVFGETVEFYNRAVEDATRFTTYLTSRQSGKSIDKSIDDAKNISLNFNRGGAGGDIKTGVKFIDNIIETIMPNTSTMRNMIVFVNPAIQALQNQAKLIFNHPVRFSAVAIAYIMRGMLQDMLNQLLGGDDDEYWNIPEWVRRNNLIIRIPKTDNFLKIPLSQEFRIWHSFGESIRSVMSGHSNGNPFIDLGESLLGLLPADPTGNGGNPMVSLAPTYLQPLVQVYINENFLGYPIRKENDKYEPEFQRVTIGTPNWLAKTSEGLNYLAGGDAHQKGAVESFARKHGGKWGDILVNPSVWNHLLGGYFGGPYTFGSGSIDMAYNWLTGEEVKVSKVPVLSRFVARPVERSQEGKMPEDYYELSDEADETMNHRNKWNKDADKDVEGAEDKVDQIEDSKEFERAEIIRDYKKQIEALRKELKETDDKEEKADISEEIKELMSDMREELGELEINK